MIDSVTSDASARVSIFNFTRILRTPHLNLNPHRCVVCIRVAPATIPRDCHYYSRQRERMRCVLAGRVAQCLAALPDSIFPRIETIPSVIWWCRIGMDSMRFHSPWYSMRWNDVGPCSVCANLSIRFVLLCSLWCTETHLYTTLLLSSILDSSHRRCMLPFAFKFPPLSTTITFFAPFSQFG